MMEMSEKTLGCAMHSVPSMPLPQTRGTGSRWSDGFSRGDVSSPIEWWSYFRGWRHIGLAAAVVAALIAGLAAYRTREASERIAYRDLLGTPSELPLLSETVGEPRANTRDATLRYLLTQ